MESRFYEENSHVIVHGSHRSRDPFVLCGVHTSIYSENAKTRVAITVVVGVKTNSTSTQSLSKTQHSRPGQQVRRTRLDSCKGIGGVFW